MIRSWEQLMFLLRNSLMEFKPDPEEMLLKNREESLEAKQTDTQTIIEKFKCRLQLTETEMHDDQFFSRLCLSTLLQMNKEFDLKLNMRSSKNQNQRLNLS